MMMAPPEGGQAVDDDELDELLKSGSFSEALQLAIAHSGLTLERIEVRLRQRGHPVGRSTLSYWQKGQRRPERPSSMDALAALEDVLGLPDKSLSALLGPRKPRGRWIGYQGQALDWGDLWTDSEAVRRLTAIDRRRAFERSQDISVTEVHELNNQRRLATLEMQILTRARMDNADRSQFVYRFEPGTDVTKIQIIGLEGCRVGRRREIAEDNLIAFEALFDRALAEGDTHFYTLTLDMSQTSVPDPQARPVVDAGRTFRRPVSSYILRLRFHPDQLPVRCFHSRTSRVGATGQDLGDLLISNEGTTHFAVQDAMPGVYWVEWEWE